MANYDSTKDTKEHINLFQRNLAILFQEIAKRHNDHDTSKLEPPEKEVFDRVTPLLRGLTYGSDEYKDALGDMKVALEHHYAHNRHHPEHFKGYIIRTPGKPDRVVNGGLCGMTLVDLIEMFCDWCAATERHDDGDIGKSIGHNMERFGFGATLASILVNTAQQLGMGKGNHLAFLDPRMDLQRAHRGLVLYLTYFLAGFSPVTDEHEKQANAIADGIQVQAPSSGHETDRAAEEEPESPDLQKNRVQISEISATCSRCGLVVKEAVEMECLRCGGAMVRGSSHKGDLT